MIHNLIVSLNVLDFVSGLLRYKVDFQSMQCDELELNEFYDLDEY